MQFELKQNSKTKSSPSEVSSKDWGSQRLQSQRDVAKGQW